MNYYLSRLSLLLIFGMILGSSLQAQITSVDFNTSQTSGCPPLFVQFSDISVVPNGTQSRVWKFSDGTTINTNANPSKFFNDPGQYTVTLIITDNNNFTDSIVKVNHITVNDKPTPNLIASPNPHGCLPHTVCFSDASFANCGTTDSILIDIGGGIQLDQNDLPYCHTYSTLGQYDVSYYYQNSCGCEVFGTWTDTIQVVSPPIANFSADSTQFCSTPANVTFTDNSVGTGLSYSWDIDCDGTIEYTSASPNHNFGLGTHDVCLYVETPIGCADTMQRLNYISVEPSRNVSFTVSDSFVCSGQGLTYTNTSDPGYTLSHWHFGFSSSFAPNPSLPYHNVGVHSTTLTVTYPGGCVFAETYSNLVTVTPAPAAAFDGDTATCLTSLTQSFTNLSTGSIAQWAWTFPGATPSLSSAENPTGIDFSGSGCFDVKLAVIDSSGCVDSVTVMDYVCLDIPVDVSIGESRDNGCIPLSVGFTPTVSVLASDPLDSIFWDFGNSSITTDTSSQLNPSYTYTDTGCVFATVEIFTEAGCSANDQTRICAGDTANIVYITDPDTICFEAEQIFVHVLGGDLDSVSINWGDGSAVLHAAAPDSFGHDYIDIGDYGISILPYQYGCPGNPVVDTAIIQGPVAMPEDSVVCGPDTNDYHKRWFYNNSTFTCQDSFHWDFGDPSRMDDTSILATPFWQYDSIGTYIVTMTVCCDSTGCCHTNTMTIDVQYPYASMQSLFDTGCAPRWITFHNTSQFPVGTVFEWVGPGHNVTSHNPVLTDWAQTFTNAGTYITTLINYDINGCTDTVSKPTYMNSVTAVFLADTTVGCNPVTVNFDEQSFSNTSVVEYRWDFECDGTVDSNLPDPTHTYSSPGFYDVCLTVIDQMGCRDSLFRDDYIKSYASSANFNVIDTFVCRNQGVGIQPLASGFNLTHEWIFPGGTPATDNVPAPGPIFYATEGIHTMQLNVVDSFGCKDTVFRDVKVFDPQPEFSGTPLNAPCPPLNVQFFDSSIYNVCSLEWHFGDGDVAFTQNAQHIYTSPGSYDVTLIAYSCTGCSDTLVKEDYVVIDGPDGDLTFSPMDACFGDSITLMLESERAVNFTTVFDNFGQSVVTNLNPPGAFGAPRYDTLGVLPIDTGCTSVTMVLDDGQGCVRFIELTDMLCVDSLNLNFGIDQPAFCDSGTICFFDSSESVITSQGAVSWIWDFGDGSFDSTMNPCHYYTTTGIHQVTLTASNAQGCSSTRTQSIYIPGSPVADFMAVDSVGCVPITSTFTDLSITDTNLVSWQWDFEHNASTINTQDPGVQNFPNPGTFDVTLVVTDTFGCTDTSMKEIVVHALPIADAGLDFRICDGDSAQLTATGGQTYIWQNNGFISDTSISNPIVYPDSGKYYHVTVIDSNNCVNADSVFVGVNWITASSTPDSVCFKDTSCFVNTSTLDGGVIDSVFWDFGDPASGALNTSNQTDACHYFTSPGVFTVHLTVVDDQGCVDTTSRSVPVGDAPDVTFIADSVCVGDTTHFTDLSITSVGMLNSWDWDFGDTNTDTVQNPVHVYAAAGTYAVHLDVSNSIGCSHDTTINVVVYSLPQADFTVDTVCEGSGNQFSDATVAGDGSLTTWNWDFGDPTDMGDSSAMQNPMYTYSADGVFPVILQVIDEHGCSSIDSGAAMVYTPPIALFTPPNVCLNDTSFFNDGSVVGSCGVVTWNWDFDDGLGSTSTQQNPHWYYSTPGSYDVHLSIVDSCGCTSDTTISVLVSEIPSVTFSADSVCLGDSTHFTDLSSTNVGVLSSWDWDFGDTNIDTVQNPVHVYAAAGTYGVHLDVSNSIGCSHDTTINVVVYSLPQADFTVDTVCEGSGNQFSDATVAGDGSLTTWNWDFGDPTDMGDSSAMQNPMYTYSTDGVFPVILQVIDEHGCSSIDSGAAMVYTPPIALFTPPNVCLNDTSFFTDGSVVGSCGVVTWNWDFDDGLGSTSTQQNPQWYYSTPGSYDVHLSIVDSCGCTSDTTISVLVSEIPSVTFSADSVCLGDSTHFTDLSSTNVGVLSSWDWDFGDTNTDTVQNPVHVYAAAGTYAVHLDVSNSIGCSHDTTINVVVYSLPQADFTVDTVCEGSGNQFSDATVAGDGSLTTWNWDFGDPTDMGDSSAMQNPMYTYSTDGVFPVILQVIDEHGCSSIDNGAAMVYTPPIALFTPPNVCLNDTSFFTDGSVVGSCGVVTWNWDFDDGLGSTSTQQNPQWYYSTPGSYDVHLSIVDSCGCTSDTTISVLVSEIPSVTFSADSVCLGDSTHFTDLSSTNVGVLSSWDWDFGDTNTDTVQNPVHVYAAAGTYGVHLDVSNSIGCSHDTTINVVVYSLPQADFTVDTVCEGSGNQFSDATVAGDGSLTTWNWDFGDPTDMGDSSAMQNPMYTYSTDGVFPVILQVIDEHGCSSIDSGAAMVYTPPIALFTPPNVCLNDTSFFNDGSVVGSCGVVTWNWDFDDGLGSTSTQQNPHWYYSTPGSYDVHLSIVDSCGCTSDTTISVLVSEIPSVTFSADSVCLGDSTHFTDLSSTNVGVLSSWDWDFGDTNIDTVQNPVHVYAAAGTYGVHLDVSNSIGCSHDTTINVVVYSLPQADFTVDTVCEGSGNQFSDATVAGDGSLTTWNWDFGDPTDMGDSSAMQNPMYTYSTDGVFPVILQVIDEHGCSSIDSGAAMVYTPPIALFTPPNVCLNDTSFFSDGSVVGSCGVVTWNWDFDDGLGSTSTQQNPQWYYSTPGSYDVHLSIVDSCGCTSDTTISVLVSEIPSVTFSADSVCLGDSTHFTDLSSTNVGALSSWDWDFGDTNTDTVQNPVHVYAAAGTYGVHLDVSNSIGCSHDTTINVVVYSLPQADFTVDTVCEGSGNQFSDATVAGDGSLTTWNWDFGDPTDMGDSSAMQNPMYTYSADGVFPVILQVIDEHGCSSIDNGAAMVYTPPIALFTPPNVCLNDTSFFSDGSVVGSCGVVTWNWDFDDGVGSTSTQQNPQWYYSTPGSYDVHLSIVDSCGCTSDTTISVLVSEIPSVVFSADSVCLGDSTHFTDLSSTNVGVLSSWDWDFGDTNTDTVQNPVHVYAAAGTYGVHLDVSNSIGCSHDTTINVVVYSLPQADFTVDTVCEGSGNQFSDATVAGDGSLTTWNWDFGDPTDMGDSSAMQNPMYTYSADGIFPVILQVIDEHGCSSIDSGAAMVYTLPVASFSVDTSCQFDTLLFYDMSTPGTGTINQWDWTIGTDMASGDSSDYVFTSYGTFTTIMSISDEHGCMSADTNQMHIHPVPTANFISDTVCGNVDSTQLTDLSTTPLGAVSAWNWSFNPGSSVLQNPMHSFPLAGGFYPVSLSVDNSFGCNADTTLNVFIVEYPVSGTPILDTACLGFPSNFEAVLTNTTLGDYNLQWDFDNDGTTDYATSGDSLASHTYPTAGMHTFTITYTYGDDSACLHTQSANTYVFAPPTADFSTSPVCETQTTFFTDLSAIGTAGLDTWDWDFDDGPGSTSNVQNPAYDYSGTGNHTVQLIVHDVHGCGDTIQRVLTVNPEPNAQLQLYPGDQICFGEALCFSDQTVVVPGNAPINNWLWITDDNGIVYPGVDTSCHVYSTTGTFDFWFVITDTNGCFDSINQTITVNALPQANFDSYVVCEDTNMTFLDQSIAGDQPLTGWNWTFNDAGGPVNSGSTNPTYQWNTPGNYTVDLVVTDALGCTATFTNTVQVDFRPNVTAFNDTTTCEGQPVMLYATGASEYLWRPPLNLDDPTNDTVIASPTFSTSYEVTGTNGVCPSDRDDVTVFVVPPAPFSVEAAPNPIILGMSSNLITDIVGSIDSIRWFPSTYLDCDDCESPVSTPDQTITYEAVIYYSLGPAQCSSRDTVTINLIDECGDDLIFLPNTFTPNGDRQNDVFYVRGNGINQVNIFRIFDRWGKVIFERTNIPHDDKEFGWRGFNNNGKELNSGVYVYMVEVICSNGDIVTKKGNVTLVR